MLTVSDLSLTYKNNEVLDGFNLELDQGDIFALLGIVVVARVLHFVLLQGWIMLIKVELS